jgi:hypothetical protein
MRKLAISILVMLSIPLAGCVSTASASASGNATFCEAFAVFGDSPTFANLAAVHSDARSAGPVLRSDYGAFESALLSGRPRTTLRTDLARVYKRCSA